VQQVNSYIHKQSIKTKINKLNNKVENCLPLYLISRVVVECKKLLKQEADEYCGCKRYDCSQQVPCMKPFHQYKQKNQICSCSHSSRKKISQNSPVQKSLSKISYCFHLFIFYETNDIISLMIKEYLEKSIAVKSAALTDPTFLLNAEKAGKQVHDSLMAGKRVYIAGNGGSAADSQHFSAELLGKYKTMRKAFPGIALTTDSSMLTAWSNDTTFDFIFSRQLEGLGQKGDIFVAISAGGNSPNILEALKVANSIGMISICLLGKGGGKAKDICTIPVVVPSDVTSHIQETHITLIHFFCEFLEN
jgi:D-sedoheptulose 7-phosphate isomerase